MAIHRLSFYTIPHNTTFTFDVSTTLAKCVQLPCYADRLTSVLCSFSSLVIRNRHRVAMYFHAPCGVVLYVFVYKVYANKEKKLRKLLQF